MRVLVVDDDPGFRKFTTIALETAGIEFEAAENGTRGLQILEESPSGRFDAVLLDVEMPETTGWDLLYEIREKGSEIPVIFITGRAAVEDRVKGLRMGADDYLTKPVEYEELIARIEAVLRRRQSLPVVEYGDLSMDLAKRRVQRAGKPLELSPREYDLLLNIIQADGQAISRKTLLRDVWGMDFDPETNVVDVHIGRVRKKLNRLGPSMIETVRGEGYRAIRSEG